MEANFDARISKFVLGASYTFLSATYQSPQLVDGGSNSANDGGLGMDGNIAIEPGNRIPDIPQHMFKAYLDFQPVRKLTVDFDLRAISGSYARGDENNLDQPDGIYYLGAPSSPSYAVVDFGARYQFEKHVQLFAQIDNLLNTHYYSAPAWTTGMPPRLRRWSSGRRRPRRRGSLPGGAPGGHRR